MPTASPCNSDIGNHRVKQRGAWIGLVSRLGIFLLSAGTLFPIAINAQTVGTFFTGDSITATVVIGPTTNPVKSASLTVVLPSGLILTGTPTAATTCRTGTVSATPNGDRVTATGISSPSGVACEVSYRITNRNGGLNASCAGLPTAFTQGTGNLINTVGINLSGTATFCVIFKPLAFSAARSTTTVITNGQVANGSSADVLGVTIRNTAGAVLANNTVNFSATSGARFAGSGASGTAGSCVTDSRGDCWINVTSTVAASYSTQVSANGAAIGTLTYNFIPGPARAGSSSVNVTVDGQLANGSSADVLAATIRDANGNAVNNAAVTFAGTTGIRLNGGVNGAAATCNTNASGICSVQAGTTTANGYSTQATVGGNAIGSAAYRFVAGPADASHSGVRVVTNDAVADATSQNVLEVFARDANDNAVTSATSVAFSSPGSDIAFDGGSRGAAGTCSISTANHVCRVNITSSDAGGGNKSSQVSIAGIALGGSFSVGGQAFAASPVAYVFMPWGPRLQIIKQVTGGTGSHTFQFTVNGLRTTTDSITVNGSGRATGANMIGYLPARPVTITESASAAWPNAPTSASCVDLASATPTATFGTLLGYQLLLSPAQTGPGANIQCAFVNSRAQRVTGKVFGDNGVGAGTANDGVANGGETGLAGVSIALTDCRALNHATSVTDGAGTYSLAVPAGLAAATPLCVENATAGRFRFSTGASAGAIALPVDTAVTVGGIVFTYDRTPAADRIAFRWPGGAATVAGLDFASVAFNSLVTAGLNNGAPGTRVGYPHTFVAATAGLVRFMVPASVSTPPTAGWSERVFADPGCTGRVRFDAALLYPPALAQAVVAAQVLCVVLEQSIPIDAMSGAHNEARLQATFTFTNASPGLSASYEIRDVTTVSTAAVQLRKEVRNVSQGVTTFGASNQAKPGDTLEYRVTYTNNTATAVSGLIVNDMTPAFTTFSAVGAGTTPPSLTSCQKSTPAGKTPVACAAAQGPGGTGALSWTFAGSLEPGATGTVLFSVVVD